MADSGDEAERHRRARSDAARKRGARRWLNQGARPPPAFDRHELDEFELERARRRRASSGNWSAGSSSVHGPPSLELQAPPLLERSARDQEEMKERVRRELEYERLFLETGLTASQAHASKEADLRVMKEEQVKLFVDLDSDSD
ncbi:hypothetical protein VPH35_122577 [Triticum aestivum]